MSDDTDTTDVAAGDGPEDPDLQLDSELRANEEFATGVRLGIAANLGQTGFNDQGSQRNHYEVFGWPRDDLDGWDEDNWLALYLRNAYGRIVVEKPAFTTWRDDPIIVEPEDSTDDETTDEQEPTAFEREIEKLAANHNLWSYCERADRAAGIGQHGLLLIGFDDIAGEDTDLNQWEADAREQDFSQLSDITGFKPILEAQIEDIDYGDLGSERWGRPVEYTIDLSDEIDSETEDDDEGTIDVHWTRVVDVPATRPLDDETLARPRMEPVLNNLLDIQKTLGAAAEAAYRAADYGLHLNADPSEVDLDKGKDDLQEELQRYEQGLQRYLRTTGMDVERLGGDIQDPSGIVENNLDAIAGQTGIPKKEFRGNESGEVSGAEADERSYFGTIAERREQYATPHIVRSTLDRLQSVDILSTPSAGEYRVEWPDLTQLSESDKADIQQKRAQVVSAVPGLAGDLAMRYLQEGADALPTDSEDDPLAANLDEGDDAVRETFEMVMGDEQSISDPATANATRYSEGDEVSTPQGVGVVADVLTSTVDNDETTVEASEGSPTYVVVVEDGRVGYETYKAEDIHSTTIETDVDEPTQRLADEEETANALGRVLKLLAPELTANDFDAPPSWRQSSTPNRIIALKAFASMGGSFDGCVREMKGEVASPDRYCGSFLDYVIGNPYWRGDSILPGD
jgi:hypothetical protein